MQELPILTDKENKCLMRYFTNNFNKSEAYRFAYDCSKMSDNTVYVEASRFFSNPKVTPWLDYFRTNQQKAVQEALNYSALDAMKEYTDLQAECMNSSKTYAVAKGCIDSKCKLAGLFDSEKENYNSSVTVMGDIVFDGQKVDYEVGESIEDAQASDIS